METNEVEEPIEDPKKGLAWSDLPRWKKILVGVSALFVLSGLALIPFDTSPAELSTQQVSDQSNGTGGTLPPGASGLVDGGVQLPDSGDGSGGTETASGSNGDLSPAFLRLGFSFFVGFAVGLAFRSLLRLALIFVGLQLLVLFGLASIEWIAIDTDAMKTSFDGMTGRIGEQFESFRSFITGSLPQASLGGLGMVAGFKKN